MSLIAEFTLQTPILRDALESTPEMMVQTENLHTGSERPSKMIFWAWGDDFQTFERGIDADSTIRRYKHLTELEDRRLYRVIMSEKGKNVFTYSAVAEHDIVILYEVGNYEGFTIRARFPGRAALTAYRDVCRAKGVPFLLQSLYPEEPIARDENYNPYGLTSSQREVLQTALDLGYFVVPRQATLEEISDELDVSVQAVSTRLRRALQTLLQNTLDH